MYTSSTLHRAPQQVDFGFVPWVRELFASSWLKAKARMMAWLKYACACGCLVLIVRDHIVSGTASGPRWWPSPVCVHTSSAATAATAIIATCAPEKQRAERAIVVSAERNRLGHRGGKAAIDALPHECVMSCWSTAYPCGVGVAWQPSLLCRFFCCVNVTLLSNSRRESTVPSVFDCKPHTHTHGFGGRLPRLPQAPTRTPS